MNVLLNYTRIAAAALALIFGIAAPAEAAKVYLSSLDAGNTRFAVYDTDSGVWRSVTGPNSGAQLAVSTGGALYALTRNPLQIKKYDPATDTWSFVMSGPLGAAGAYGNLEISNSGEFYYTEQNNRTLYYTRNGAWNTFNLWFAAGTMGDYDPTTEQYVIGQFCIDYVFAVDPITFTVTPFLGDSAGCDTKRGGVIFNNRFYYQLGGYPIKSYNLLDSSEAPRAESNNFCCWAAGAADRGASRLFFTNLGGDTFSVFDPASRVFTRLANPPTPGSWGHSSIAFVGAAKARTDIAVDAVSGAYGEEVSLSARLTSGGGGLSGRNISFTLNGNSVGSAPTDYNGVASINHVRLPAAGVYPTGVAAAFGGDTAHESVQGEASLNVARASISVEADSKTKAYGDGDPALTYEITSGNLVNGDAFTGALTRVAGENVGPYAINQGTLALSINYALTFTPSSLTINARPITVAADAKSKAYGDADPAFTYQITSGNLVNGDTFSGALTRDPGENVNSYAIDQGTLALGTNYALSFTPSSLTIGARSIGVTADAKSKTYGDADPALTYQITAGNLVNGDTFSGALTRDPGENVNSYAISRGTLALSSNYALAFTGSSLTIGARSIGITADSKSKTYGDADPALTYQVTSGNLVNGDSFSGALARDAGENVGSYAINQGTLALSSNYSLTFTFASLTISPRSITIGADPKTKYYGDSDPALTYQIVDGALVNGDSFDGSLARDPGESAGDYAITQGTVILSSNYDLHFVAGAHLTIVRRPITIAADAKSKTYGDSDPALTYQVTAGNLVNGDTFSGALTRDAGENVASYAIYQGSVALSPNYELHFVPGASLTITPRSITITADAKSKTYGDSDPALTYQVTAGNLVNGDSFTGTLTRDAGESVGTYLIGQGSVALSSNYDLHYGGANFTISARPVVITADAKSKTYGDSDPALTYQITSGSLVSGDSFAGSLTRATGESVGNYAIGQGTVALSSNYDLTFHGADLTITTRPVTVTADAKSKVYGDAEPALTYQVTSGSLAFSDAFTGSLARAAGESVGSYAITQGTLALSTNYALTFAGANLTITQRPVTVTADAKSKILGQSDPALTYQLTSGTLVNGDVFSGTLTRTAGEAVGSYPIQQGTLTLGGNYAITYVGANFTITYASAAQCGHVILQPINADGTSVFKKGSTVPAKFRVCDANGNSVGTAGVVAAFNLVQIMNGTVTDNVEQLVSSTTPDSTFRWDSTAQQWIFNVNTKGLNAGQTYVYRISLNDGSTIYFQFGLK